METFAASAICFRVVIRWPSMVYLANTRSYLWSQCFVKSHRLRVGYFGPSPCPLPAKRGGECSCWCGWVAKQPSHTSNMIPRPPGGGGGRGVGGTATFSL